MTYTIDLPYGIPTANKLTLLSIKKIVGSVFFGSSNKENEIPTQYLLDTLQESEEDYKAGRYKSFASGQDALDYLDAKIITSKKTK